MIDRFLACDWDEAPEAMDFETPWDEAVTRTAELVATLRKATETDAASVAAAVELFTLAPAIVNVALNHAICVEFGLPLHPTVYFEFEGESRDTVRYRPDEIAFARGLYPRAIGLARAAYRLAPGLDGEAEAFVAALPGFLRGFVYESRRDRYTWRAAEPAKVRALAESVRRGGIPSLALGAAHGSIMAGLLLAEYLGCPLWFLRFSMFKRMDKEPVVSPRDEQVIRERAAEGTVLVFDEDSASGTTLSIMAERVRRIVPEFRTGAVIRHMTSSFKPDCVGKTWWD